MPNRFQFLDWLAMETLRLLHNVDPSFGAVLLDAGSGTVSSCRANGFIGGYEQPFTVEQVGDLLKFCENASGDLYGVTDRLRDMLAHYPQRLADDAFRVASFG